MPYVTSWERIAKKEGMREGIREGKREGKREGMQEGKREGKWDVVRNSLKEGLPIPIIERITGISSEEITRLREELAHTN